MEGRMEGRKDGWMDGRESGVKDCLQQSKMKNNKKKYTKIFCNNKYRV